MEILPQSIEQYLLSFNEWLRLLPDDAVKIYIINAFIIYIVLHALRMVAILVKNKQLAFKSERWNSTEAGTVKILILGDSTAVGTGASSAKDSIAGRLAKDFPRSEIRNLGKNGGLISDVKTQIMSVAHERFDLIIISAGGNDAWSFTSLKSIDNNLTTVFSIAKEISAGKVFFLVYNNLGDAPIFPKIIRLFLRIRTTKIQHQILDTATRLNVPIINLFTDTKNNPFTQSPKTLFAADGIHPSSEGYRLWYNRMWREMIQMGYHFTDHQR